jgi:hypothetical protein
MGLKSDKAVYEGSTVMVLKHQGRYNFKNRENINNILPSSTYDNNIYNTHTINDSRIVNHDIETSSKNQDHPGNANPPNKIDKVALTIFHQNIRGLHNKIDELLNCWSTELPHILCFTDHHLRDYQINSTCINHYNLGSKYCRKSRKYGGVSIFVQENLLFSTIELTEFCNDQDFEVCAVTLHTSTSKLCVMCL